MITLCAYFESVYPGVSKPSANREPGEVKYQVYCPHFTDVETEAWSTHKLATAVLKVSFFKSV